MHLLITQLTVAISVGLPMQVSSPRRSQVPGSPFTQVQPVQVQPLQVQPSSPFAAPQLSGTAFGSERPRGGNSDIGDLEVAARACSIASVRSNASFNSEEGFGSPSTNRRVKNRHPMPELAESSFEVIHMGLQHNQYTTWGVLGCEVASKVAAVLGGEACQVSSARCPRGSLQTSKLHMSFRSSRQTWQHVFWLPLQGGKAVVVVIMEFCDMGTLLRAITKQAFKPHGKWKLHTTYVRSAACSCATLLIDKPQASI